MTTKSIAYVTRKKKGMCFRLRLKKTRKTQVSRITKAKKISKPKRGYFILQYRCQKASSVHDLCITKILQCKKFLK
jgi:hypothetical protein